MKNRIKELTRRGIKVLVIFTIIFTLLVPESLASSDRSEGKKVIVFIMDEISLGEMIDSDTPNIDRLLETGSIGFMNTRGRSSLANKGSRYLSLGMGVRTLASTRGRLAFDRDEIESLIDNNLAGEGTSVADLYELNTGKELPEGELVNIALADIKRQAFNITPNNQIGYLGKLARENGIKIGFVGNTDTKARTSRESTLIAIDENGIIPYGSVAWDLLKEDKYILGGLRTDDSKMMEEIDRVLDRTDLLFIEYGDTTRLERSDNISKDDIRERQKLMSIERGDSFLGRVMDRVDMNKTRFIILAPNTSSKMASEGNFGLTPLIVSDRNMDKGLITSNTTRREGLVTNFDFGPTVIDYLNNEISTEFIGEPIEGIEKEDPISILVENESDFLYLRKYRKVFHWIYIGLVMVTLLASYLPFVIKKLDKFSLSNEIVEKLSLTILSTPLMMMTVSIFGYKNIFIDILYVFLGAFILGYLLNKIFKDGLKTMGVLGLLTSLILIVDTYLVRELMIVSPLGSDAIAGGRFYGIGNDYMGILLGSSLIFLFILFKKLNKKPMMAVTFLYLSLIIVSLSPLVGANMGGTISALVSLILGMMAIMDRKISVKKLIGVLAIVVVLILLIAGFDIMFNPNPTHAGKAMKALFMDGQGGKLFEIISSKLRQVFWNLAYSPWNIVLFSEVVLILVLWRRKKNILASLKEENKSLFKGLFLILFTSMAIFFFNDTGTIGAALCMIYLFIPLGNAIGKIQIKNKI